MIKKHHGFKKSEQKKKKYFFMRNLKNTKFCDVKWLKSISETKFKIFDLPLKGQLYSHSNFSAKFSKMIVKKFLYYDRH